MQRINVTKSFLPPLEEYERYLKEIWANDQLTNQGPLVRQLESELISYLGVENLHFVSNGTTALQLALRALDITEGEVITTPFTYVATTSSILWEHCTPVYVDINPQTLCIDVDKIEAAITPNTRAIMPVHVFGIPCDVEKIGAIAQKHNLKVIYDAAHAFGAEYKGKSLMDYGDIAIGSFHATKLFHTIEGGCLIVKDKSVSEKVELMKRFGHNGDEHFMLGINAKANEFQAAMGLCNLPYVERLMEKRGRVVAEYDRQLKDYVERPVWPSGMKVNNAYYPVLFQDEAQLLKVTAALTAKNIFPRRYFYPSLNKLPYVLNGASCAVAEQVAGRILCLPLYADLETQVITEIATTIEQKVAT